MKLRQSWKDDDNEGLDDDAFAEVLKEDESLLGKKQFDISENVIITFGAFRV